MLRTSTCCGSPGFFASDLACNLLFDGQARPVCMVRPPYCREHNRWKMKSAPMYAAMLSNWRLFIFWC
eukprot:6204648-Pleurochrysis_carterae.AAC.1